MEQTATEETKVTGRRKVQDVTWWLEPKTQLLSSPWPGQHRGTEMGRREVPVGGRWREGPGSLTLRQEGHHHSWPMWSQKMMPMWS